MGYFGRKKLVGYLRVSIDTDHPQDWLDATPADPSRWNAHKIRLREDVHAMGHIILVGLGHKSRSYLGLPNWERDKLAELRRRFPEHEVIYRPKPRRPFPNLSCTTDDTSPIEALLQNAALVVCRHSNVAVDAAIAGVPFECENGAAMWLLRRPFTYESRLEFLRKLAWWQWHKGEAQQAWSFIRTRIEERT